MCSFFAEDINFANIGLQNSDVVFYSVTDSTNTRAREAFLSAPVASPSLFVAEEQTAGRGTRGRSFESKRGGLYFSLLIPTGSDSYADSRITPFAAAAAADALSALLGRKNAKRIRIKWVNDIYIDEKKVAGILCERISADGKNGYIIGIGINLYGSDFSPEVAKVAASVEDMTGERIDGGRLLYEILGRLIPALTSHKKSALAKIYRRRSLKRGTEIYVTDSEGSVRTAKILGLDSEFHLRVRYSDGEKKTLVSGDVSIKF